MWTGGGRTAGTPCILSWDHGGRQPCSSYPEVVKGLEPSGPSPAAQLLGLPWKLGLPGSVSGLLGAGGGLFTGQKPFRQWEKPRLQHGRVAGWQDPSPGQACLYAEQPRTWSKSAADLSWPPFPLLLMIMVIPLAGADRKSGCAPEGIVMGSVSTTAPRGEGDGVPLLGMAEEAGM